MKSILAAAAALSLGSTAYAYTSTCPESDVCYSLSIPDSTAKTNNGDIYFQISAPTSYEWVALGQGSSMIGANIFVMYTSSDGKNVTVSPRLGKAHVEPLYDSAAHITVLEGSGVSDGKMIANVRCSNCQSWSGGSMDFSSSSASWIFAMLSGSPLNSDSLEETITEHSSEGPLAFTISQARGGSEDVNPFVSTSSGSGSKSGKGSAGVIPATCTPIPTSTIASAAGSGCPTALPSAYLTAWPTATPAWFTRCYPNGYDGHTSWPTAAPWETHNKKKRDDSCPAGYQSTESPSDSQPPSFANNGFSSLTQRQQMALAHGVLAALAFVGLFPIGGIMIRLANFTGLIWVHAAFQCVAYLIYIIAFAMGVYLATHLGYMTNAHPILGIALFLVLLTQPVAGYLHHRLFKKYGHRTFWSYMHLFHGRVAIFLGMINGGLGIKLAGTASIPQRIAYGVIAAIMALIYIAAIIMGELRRRGSKAPPTYENSQKAHQLRDLSGSEESVPNSEFYGKRTPGTSAAQSTASNYI